MWVARIRASRSAEPPAPNGTTMVTCRCGHSCAWADAARPRMHVANAIAGARMANLRWRMACKAWHGGTAASTRCQLESDGIVGIVAFCCIEEEHDPAAARHIPA